MIVLHQAGQPAGLVGPAHRHDPLIRGAMDCRGPSNQEKQGGRPRPTGQDNLDRERSVRAESKDRAAHVRAMSGRNFQSRKRGRSRLVSPQ